MYKIIISLFLYFFSFSLQAIDSSLSLKQQLDRLQREVSDLSQSVFKGTNNISSLDANKITAPINLTAFDLRIYDIEKDIKNLNESFEELIFQIDDLKKMYFELSSALSNQLSGEFVNKDLNEEDNLNISSEDINNEISAQGNTLGSLVINSEDLTETNQNKIPIVEENNSIENNSDEDLTKLNAEEEFQIAFDMIRNQQFLDAKIALKNFIEKYKDLKLVGSAHYWLGEIYLLKKEYREAALILAEGYQKFPLSFKAPDMLFKLSDSLNRIDKTRDSCSTLKKLVDEFPKHKLAFKALDKSAILECDQFID